VHVQKTGWWMCGGNGGDRQRMACEKCGETPAMSCLRHCDYNEIIRWSGGGSFSPLSLQVRSRCAVSDMFTWQRSYLVKDVSPECILSPEGAGWCSDICPEFKSVHSELAEATSRALQPSSVVRKMAVFWVVAPCRQVWVYRRFGSP
jgi:hypothetical protein